MMFVVMGFCHLIDLFITSDGLAFNNSDAVSSISPKNTPTIIAPAPINIPNASASLEIDEIIMTSVIITVMTIVDIPVIFNAEDNTVGLFDIS